MHLVRLLLIVSLLLPITAAAKTVTVRGEGNASCSSWTQEHALGSNRQRDQDSWLLGYVNATSAMLDIPGIEDVSAPLSNSDLVAWMDRYCSAFPDQVLIRAADALMWELARRAVEAN